MPTETVSDPTPTPPPSLDSQIARAEAHAATLEAEAEQADAAASKAALAFKSDPTSAHFTAAEVAKQRAANAHTALAAFTTDCLEPLRAARQAALDDAEREQIRAETDPALMDAEFARLESALRGVANIMEQTLGEITRLTHVRSKHANRAAALGVGSPPLRFEQRMKAMSERLASQLATPGTLRHFSLVIGSGPNVCVQIHRPAAYLPAHSL